MRRKLFNPATALSLVLCVGICVLSLSGWKIWYEFGQHLREWGAFHIAIEGRARSGLAFYISWWYPLILSSILPGLWLRREIRDQKLMRLVRLDRCAVCGYDLRVTPDRCPECGTAARPPAARSAAP